MWVALVANNALDSDTKKITNNAWALTNWDSLAYCHYIVEDLTMRSFDPASFRGYFCWRFQPHTSPPNGLSRLHNPKQVADTRLYSPFTAALTFSFSLKPKILWRPSLTVADHQLVVTSIFKAGWTLGRIGCIFVVWLTIFAIMGVLLWSGERNLNVTPLFQNKTIMQIFIVSPSQQQWKGHVSQGCWQFPSPARSKSPRTISFWSLLIFFLAAMNNQELSTCDVHLEHLRSHLLP